MEKMTDIKQKSDSELTAFINEKRESLRKIRFASAGSGMRDVKGIRSLRTEIARARTEETARRKAKAANA
jgi:ribosomal protein L29